MTATQRLTFADYLDLGDGDDRRYESIDGRLVGFPESEPTISLANLLQIQLISAGLPFRLVHPHLCEVQVPVLQAGDAANSRQFHRPPIHRPPNHSTVTDFAKLRG
ncbi:MAG: hypothetical protein AAFY15_11555 [Cyanobacteria bacterium J06648_11]